MVDTTDSTEHCPKCDSTQCLSVNPADTASKHMCMNCGERWDCPPPEPTEPPDAA